MSQCFDLRGNVCGVWNNIYNLPMTKFDPQRHHRRSIRLKGYDYSQEGAYYVTIVTWRREFLFGEIVNKEMRSNQRGQIADACWREIPNHFPHVELGAYVIMPNHMHGIIVIRRGTIPSTCGLGRCIVPLRTMTIRMMPISKNLGNPSKALYHHNTHIQSGCDPSYRARIKRNRDLAAQLLRPHHPR